MRCFFDGRRSKPAVTARSAIHHGCLPFALQMRNCMQYQSLAPSMQDLIAMRKSVSNASSALRFCMPSPTFATAAPWALEANWLRSRLVRYRAFPHSTANVKLGPELQFALRTHWVERCKGWGGAWSWHACWTADGPVSVSGHQCALLPWRDLDGRGKMTSSRTWLGTLPGHHGR